jgi:sialidase-1
MNDSNTQDEIDAILDSGSAGHAVGPASLHASDERVLLAYVRTARDNQSQVVTAESTDEGKTWNVPRLAARSIGLANPSFVRLASGRAVLGFERSAATRVEYLTQYSDDGATTWSPPAPLTPGGPLGGSLRAGNDRLIQLASGRLLLPVFEIDTGCVAWISDDQGLTWRRGRGAVRPGEGEACSVPVAVELRDGTVAMLLRTDNPAQVIYTAHSRDGGDTWEMFNDWGPVSLLAPFAVRRVPSTDDLLLVWINHSIPTNLVSAVSRDGRLWGSMRTLEEQQSWPVTRHVRDPGLAFTSRFVHLTFVEDELAEGSPRRSRLVYRRLPIGWFYQAPPRRKAAYDVEAFIRDFIASKPIHDPRVRAMVTAPFNPVSVVQVKS